MVHQILSRWTFAFFSVIRRLGGLLENSPRGDAAVGSAWRSAGTEDKMQKRTELIHLELMG